MTETNKKNRIFITGGAGYIGTMLAEIFSAREDVEAILLLDKNPIPDYIKILPKINFISGNTSDDSWQKKASEFNPNIVIHTAWQIREMYGQKKLQWKWNIDGSNNVFDFAFSAPFVEKIIHFSTVASYGAYSTNTLEYRFKEDDKFRKTDYLYAEEKRIAESNLENKFKKAKDNGSIVKVAIIRPASITGPKGRYLRNSFGLQSVLSGQLSKSFLHKVISLLTFFTPITKKWCRQYIHEDDIAGIVTLLAFSDLKNNYDVFNACPPGPVVTGKQMASAVNKKGVIIHPFLIRIVFFLAWNLTLGKIPTSKGGWKSYSYPIAVDGSKITDLYGYKYKYQSFEAFTEIKGNYAEKAKKVISERINSIQK